MSIGTFTYLSLPVDSHMILDLPFHRIVLPSTALGMSLIKYVFMRAWLTGKRLKVARNKSEITGLDFCDVNAEGAKRLSCTTTSSRYH